MSPIIPPKTPPTKVAAHGACVLACCPGEILAINNISADKFISPITSKAQPQSHSANTSVAQSTYK